MDKDGIYITEKILTINIVKAFRLVLQSMFIVYFVG